MPICHGVREVAKLDIVGGGQVDVVGNYAYVGHMSAPDGTSVVDVSDPKKPRIVAEIKIPKGIHSHKGIFLLPPLKRKRLTLFFSGWNRKSTDFAVTAYVSRVILKNLF